MVDVFVAGAGTGGTITGVSRAIRKRHNPNVRIVGVDPVRLLVFSPLLELSFNILCAAF